MKKMFLLSTIVFSFIITQAQTEAIELLYGNCREFFLRADAVCTPDCHFTKVYGDTTYFLVGNPKGNELSIKKTVLKELGTDVFYQHFYMDGGKVEGVGNYNFLAPKQKVRDFIILKFFTD